MYFVGIMIFIIIGNIILFIGNGLNDLCNWRDAKDSWNPYTQSKNKYWIDHKGRTRYVCNGKIKDGSIEAKEISDKKEKDRIRFNELSKKKAINAGKNTYMLYDVFGYNKKCKGEKYKDLETGEIYVKRKGIFNHFIFYMNIKNGLYVKETEESISFTDDYNQRENEKCECEQHNLQVIRGEYKIDDDIYDNFCAIDESAKWLEIYREISSSKSIIL